MPTLKIGGQLSKTKLKELLKTLPGYYKKQDKDLNPHQFELTHRLSYDENVLTFPAGKGCSFKKTMEFCKANNLPFECSDYGVQRWEPGTSESDYSSNFITTQFLEDFVECMDTWKIEDAPLNINIEEKDMHSKARVRIARHILKTGKIDKYALLKVWFKFFLPMQLPRFEWTD